MKQPDISHFKDRMLIGRRVDLADFLSFRNKISRACKRTS